MISNDYFWHGSKFAYDTRHHDWSRGVLISPWLVILQIGLLLARDYFWPVTPALDVDNVKTTGERCCHLSWRTPWHCPMRMFIGINTFWYIITMYLRLTTFTKTLPKCHFNYFFPLRGSTHNSADCWSADRSPASRGDSFKRVHDWCKAGWRRPGAPPPHHGYAGASTASRRQPLSVVGPETKHLLQDSELAI